MWDIFYSGLPVTRHIRFIFGIFPQSYLLQGLSGLDVVYISSVLPVTRTIRCRCGIYFLSLTCYKDYQV